jgi:hypothetical protein
MLLCPSETGGTPEITTGVAIPETTPACRTDPEPAEITVMTDRLLETSTRVETCRVETCRAGTCRYRKGERQPPTWFLQAFSRSPESFLQDFVAASKRISNSCVVRPACTPGAGRPPGRWYSAGDSFVVLGSPAILQLFAPPPATIASSHPPRRMQTSSDSAGASQNERCFLISALVTKIGAKMQFGLGTRNLYRNFSPGAVFVEKRVHRL